MQIGMIGLGRMGANMARRLLRGGHRCGVFDTSAESVRSLVGDGATGSQSLDDFFGNLGAPRNSCHIDDISRAMTLGVERPATV